MGGIVCRPMSNSMDAEALLATPPGISRRARTACAIEAECVLSRAVFWLLVSRDPCTLPATFALDGSRADSPTLEAILSLVKKIDDCFRELHRWSGESTDPPSGDATWAMEQWTRNLQAFSARTDALAAAQPQTSSERELLLARSRIVESLSIASDLPTVDALLDCTSLIVEREVLRSVAERRPVASALLCPLPVNGGWAIEARSIDREHSSSAPLCFIAEVNALRVELEDSIRDLRNAARSERTRQ
jgi:hypothetical protein